MRHNNHSKSKKNFTLVQHNHQFAHLLQHNQSKHNLYKNNLNSHLQLKSEKRFLLNKPNKNNNLFLRFNQKKNKSRTHSRWFKNLFSYNKKFPSHNSKRRSNKNLFSKRFPSNNRKSLSTNLLIQELFRKSNLNNSHRKVFNKNLNRFNKRLFSINQNLSHLFNSTLFKSLDCPNSKDRCPVIPYTSSRTSSTLSTI